MGLFFKLKKAILEKQEKLANKHRIQRQEALKKEVELEKIKERIKKASKLKLSKSDKEILIRKRKVAEDRKKRAISGLKQIGKQLSRVSNNIADSVDKSYGNKRKGGRR